MPDSDGDVEARLAVLEREIARLREQAILISSDAAARGDAAAARVLAAGVDRDVSEVRAELRAHIQALNALRETQLEQAQKMREGFAEMRREMREGFATQSTGMAQITALLTKDHRTRDELIRSRCLASNSRTAAELA